MRLPQELRRYIFSDGGEPPKPYPYACLFFQENYPGKAEHVGHQKLLAFKLALEEWCH